MADEHVSGKSNKLRPVSPPWKKIAIEGPASFIEDGRRKSSRTNAIPLDLRPQSGKRQTRAAIQKDNEGKSLHLRKSYGSLTAKTSYPFDEMNGLRPPRAETVSARSSPRPKSSARSTGATRASPIQNGFNSNHSHDREPPLNHREHSRHLNDESPHMSMYTNGIHKESASSGKRRKHSAAELHPTQDVLPKYGLNRNTRITDSPPSPTSTRPKLQRIRFTVKMPTVDVTHPGHVLPSKKYPSFREWFEKDSSEPQNGAGLWDYDTVEEKANERYHFLRQQRPGGLLTDAKLVDPEDQEASRYPFPEPSRQYAHHDHLIAHAKHLRYLQEKEIARHRRTARILARQALDHPLHLTIWQNRQLGEPEIPMTKEMAAEKQYRIQESRYKRLVRDIERQWESVHVEVQSLRQAELDEQQREQEKKQLNRVLEHHKEMLKTRRPRSLQGNDEDEEDIESTLNSESTNLSDDDSNMSTSENESSSETEVVDDDENLTADELRRKYAKLPKHSANDDFGLDNTSVPDEDIEESFLLENAHEDIQSTDSGNHIYATAKDSSDIEDVGATTLGFFASSQRQQFASDFEQREEAGVDTDAETAYPLKGDKAALDLSSAPPRNENLSARDQAAGSSSENFTVQNNMDKPKEPDDHRTPIPSLLRGTLREYQHDGLDWLARQYANHHNGILADEMGLGKTIQSIALLAHLAVKHEVWGPHLIVVPTSVMLNWEMEFKKWCPGFKIMTYYGTIEERKQKRRGWMDDDMWNVCITSYQLVLQDQQPFKRRNWHYMILDEAHNIKNFRSQRWQALLGFKTRARLLLTGTPLQNNLSELWSLLFFLNSEHDAFANLSEFSSFFGKAVGQILEHGRDTINDDDKKQISELQTVLRPYLLRRLKADVEKQMPAKYEHVEMCRLSKRQRQLYDGFMSRAQTKETLASGNYLSIINCLMQLRKVCNHPDLFETRPIMTSFAMSRSVAARFESNELLVRRQLLRDQPIEKLNLDFLNATLTSRENLSSTQILDIPKLISQVKFQRLQSQQQQRASSRKAFVGSSRSDVLASLENIGRESRMAELDRMIYCLSLRRQQRALWGSSFLKFLTKDLQYRSLSPLGMSERERWDWLQGHSSVLQKAVPSLEHRSNQLEPIIQKFAFLTPSVVAANMSQAALTETGVEVIRKMQTRHSSNPFHEAQTRLAIAFPDKRLLQYDCGKLQRLDKLLRDLQAGGHRALIFTQMTKVLDILEQFLNIHGHRYLRLDGATRIEQRQILTDRFNNDTRILAFILSSRSGGLGINLTGADTVIFYDLDWNPAMDKQCQDRCHRIGQTRDVHIYRFVSEHTIESNILRKSNQKRMLDDVVIQEGDFTTDYFNKLSVRDMVGDDLNDADMLEGAGLDRVLGSSKGALSQVEDHEDAAAAKAAEREVQNIDDADFSERAAKDTSATPMTPGPAPQEGELGDDDGSEGVQLDEYFIRTMRWLLRDEPLVLESSKKKKTKKVPEHRVTRKR